MLVEAQLLGMILGSEGEVALCPVAVHCKSCCGVLGEPGLSHQMVACHRQAPFCASCCSRTPPLAFIALGFSKHGHKVDICKDCGYQTVAGRLEKHVCT